MPVPTHLSLVRILKPASRFNKVVFPQPESPRMLIEEASSKAISALERTSMEPSPKRKVLLRDLPSKTNFLIPSFTSQGVGGIKSGRPPRRKQTCYS